MRAINVSEAGAPRIYSAIKILSRHDSIEYGRDRVDRLRTLVSYM